MGFSIKIRDLSFQEYVTSTVRSFFADSKFEQTESIFEHPWIQWIVPRLVHTRWFFRFFQNLSCACVNQQKSCDRETAILPSPILQKCFYGQSSSPVAYFWTFPREICSPRVTLCYQETKVDIQLTIIAAEIGNVSGCDRPGEDHFFRGGNVSHLDVQLVLESLFRAAVSLHISWISPLGLTTNSRFVLFCYMVLSGWKDKGIKVCHLHHTRALIRLILTISPEFGLLGVTISVIVIYFSNHSVLELRSSSIILWDVVAFDDNH